MRAVLLLLWLQEVAGVSVQETITRRIVSPGDVQYTDNTVQYSTVQYSITWPGGSLDTVQYSTVQVGPDIS